MALLEGLPVIAEDLLEGVFVDPLHGGCHSAGLYHVLAPRSTRLCTLLRPSLPIVSPCRDGQKGGFSKRKFLYAPVKWLIRQVDGRMIVLSDTALHAAEGDPANLKLCQRGEWEDRMLVETVLSMLTLVCHFKKVMHRGWAYFQARLAFTMAAFNVLVQWHGFQPNASGFVPLSIAEFSL